MTKIQQFSAIQKQLPLFPDQNFELFKTRFFNSDLGKIYQATPWADLIKAFGLKKRKRGSPQIFPPQGRIALMLLKNYSGLSDAKLIEQLNGNIEWQFFCDIYLGFNNRIDNYKIVSQIRCELSLKLDILEVEKILYNHWKPYISEPEKIVVDATCYESEVRYPTDVKLLWESVEWCHIMMVKVCERSSKVHLRTKFIKWKKNYVSFSKMRLKRVSKRHALQRGSLNLIKKITEFLEQNKDFLLPRELRKLNIINEVYEQQHAFFHDKEKPTNRIVSLSKPYLRPIVRGKEIKPVEFGAKVNKIQIDGISFIEHINFNAFHEGIRLTKSVDKAQGLTRRIVKTVGADSIYATNKNRNYITKRNIKTDFKPKGRPAKDYKQAKKASKIITKERASRLEGSFGKDKEHYHLRKVKAKTERNEILWIFFGIHVSNALEIGRRMSKVEVKAAV